MKDVVILDAARTPRGRGKAGKGALSAVHPQELMATVLRALPARTGFDVGDVDDVIAGIVSQVNEQGANLARNAVLAAGWPEAVPGTSINRFCGSGLQAVAFGAQAIAAGDMKLVVAGGVESMSRVPMASDGGGVDGDNEALRKRVFQVPQGISADLIATREKFTRADVDAVALASQQHAAVAMEQKRFAKSIIGVHGADGALLLDRDELPRPATTLAALSELAPSFVGLGATELGPNGETLDALARLRYPDVQAIEHVHTAGNSSGLADGAAAVVLASAAYAKERGLKPRAKIRSFAVVGAEPVIMLTAPAPAVQKALKLAGLSVADVDLFEINEAFAAVVLQTSRALGISLDRVNVNGGAIALGHPLGATGAMLLGTVVDELERRGGRIGVVTLCIGGGQAVAMVVERTDA